MVSLLRGSTRTVPIPGWFPLVVEQLHPHVTGEASVVEVESSDVRMRLNLEEYTQRRIFYGAYEPGEVSIFRRLLRPGDVALDVGAHVGFFTLLAAAAVGPNGEVYALEPAPDNYASLEANVKLNGFRHVILKRAAAGKEPGTIEMGVTAAGGSNTGGYTQDGEGRSFTAQAITLDDYVADRIGDKPVRLVKIDVEGVEPLVLEGFRRNLENRPPEALLIEVNVDMLGLHGFRTRDIVEPLVAAGFSLFRIGAAGRLRTLRPADIDTAPTPPAPGPTRGVANLIRQGLRERRTFFNLLALQDGVRQPTRAAR
jgi:FkbM family methyltransferase